MLDLVTAETREESITNKRMIRKVISERRSYSLFVGLAPARSQRMSSISEEGSEMSLAGNNEDQIKSLLHLTPVKDGKVSRCSLGAEKY